MVGNCFKIFDTSMSSCKSVTSEYLSLTYIPFSYSLRFSVLSFRPVRQHTCTRVNPWPGCIIKLFQPYKFAYFFIQLPSRCCTSSKSISTKFHDLRWGCSSASSVASKSSFLGAVKILQQAEHCREHESTAFFCHYLPGDEEVVIQFAIILTVYKQWQIHMLAVAEASAFLQSVA